MKKIYNHRKIEEKWNKIWADNNQHQVDVENAKDKFYCLDMFPYPSGDGLHVGHWRGYTMSDFYTRHAMLSGKTVLHPMGYDAFGLPAENAAIKNKSHPKKYTDKAVENFSSQLKQMGAMFDWSKEINTSNPEYYRWTQWLFLQLYKKGYAQKRKSLVNWCPKDQTVLANEQVVDGCCERCGTKVTKKELEQWYFLTTKLAGELLDGLDNVEWPERVKNLQRNWIGKSDGAEIKFEVQNSKFEITVFTTRPDTLFGVTALVLAPEHPLTAKLAKVGNKQQEFDQYFKEVSAKTNIDRAQAKESKKTAIDLGVSAVHPLTGQQIPIWTADYVLMDYGTGAVMSVPAHDERDFMFAKAHNLPIKQVISERLTQSYEPGMYRPEMPTVSQDGVIVFVKHWAADKYIGLKWKTVDWGTLLTGSVDDGETPESTVLKELREETGYCDAKIVSKLGIVDGLFFHVPKNVNKLVHGHVYLVELNSDKKQKVTEAENMKHEVRWLTVDELAGFLTADTHKYALRWLSDGYRPALGAGTLIDSGKYSGEQSDEAAERIVADLESTGQGKFITTYRLRDWLVSRQRYWGAPIPIVYDPEGNPHPISEERLPLMLPEDVDFAAISKSPESLHSDDDFLPVGKSPLGRSADYANRAEKLYGKGWRYDTDTLDTFVDSSWYFLRYLTPHNDQQAFDKRLVTKWLPVDLYVGGIEHATLHLLYARFIYRFLEVEGYLKSTGGEPFKKLFNIGMITLHGAKMSKSKGNVVSPDPLIEHYGTDALRGYELFVGPMDQDAEWNPRGINGIHRFLIKLFSIKPSVAPNGATNSMFDQYLKKIDDQIANYRLNTYLSSAMEFANEASKTGIDKETFGKFITTLSPVFPYTCEEIWQSLGNESSVFSASWPQTQSTNQHAVDVWKLLKNQKFIKNFEVKAGTEPTEEQILAEQKQLGTNSRQYFVNKAGKVVNIVVS